MKKMLSYLKPYWKAAVLAPILMMIEVYCDLQQPKLMANIVDKGVAAMDLQYIFHTGLIMVGVTLIGMIGGVGCTIFSCMASQSFGADLRVDLFRKIQEYSFTELDDFKTGSLITRLTNDVTMVQNVVLAMLRILVRSPLLCIGGIVMAVSINSRLALILLGAIPFLVAALAVIIRKGFPLFSKVQEKLDRVNTVMQENLSGVRVVKAFVRSPFEVSRFRKANEDQTEISVKASRVMASLMPVMMLVMNASIIAVIWFGGIHVNTGNMKLGEVIAFINYMTQILNSLMMVAFTLMSFSRAKASMDRVNEVLKRESSIKNEKDAYVQLSAAGRVEFQNVSFRYEGAGGEPVLKNISFRARPGETIAILGSTGAGKSTLVNLIPRFYDTTEGKILVDGTDVRQIELDVLRNSIGMVLQESILFTGTIRDNIKWGNPDAGETDVIEAARAAQAHDFILSFPDGYDTVLGQRGVNLSGGQKQRLSIARALLKKPAVLIMDDSTSAVDMGTESRIQSALKEMKKQCTCFIIAQRISSVMDADKILVLEDGFLAAEGTHQELLKSCEIYQDIYDSQIGKEAV